MQPDDTFLMDPNADLPFDRDFTEWLDGENLVTVSWAIANPALLSKHDESNTPTVARVWLQGTGTEGITTVTCEFESDIGRLDHRTWKIELRHR